MIGDKSMQLSFKVTNNSARDIWMCESMNVGSPWHFEVDFDDETQTLFIQRRLDMPMQGSGEQPMGRYVRLRSGDARTELMSLALPVRPRRVLSGGRVPRPPTYAKRLFLDIGYYVGDLPGMVSSSIEDAEKTHRMGFNVSGNDKPDILRYMGGLLYFTANNEGLHNRTEEVNINYTWQTLKGERFLRLALDDVRIPYWAQIEKLTPPDLARCTRIEIRFKSSALSFFFPDQHEQSLFDLEEKQYLQSLTILTVANRTLLKAFADDANRLLDDAFVTQRGVAEVVCYRENERLMTMAIYNASDVVNERGQVFRRDGGLQSLRGFTPELQSLDVRVRCAANIKDLWYRLQTYRRTKTYPAPIRWCDDIVDAFTKLTGLQDAYVKNALRCPSRDKGDCGYAMNPNCALESAGNVILLFETKPAWNQHGGPELFTFDNHDPKGGLVLLNDGTVKFIRTKEELKQLRWK